MDPNGQRFWLLADGAHWRARQGTSWDARCRTLRLSSERRLDAPVDPAAFAAANSALEVVPRAVDAHDAVARWDSAERAIVVRSYLPGEAVRLPLAERPTDLCVGPTGVLYVALSDRVHLHDLRGRWPDTAVRLAGFAPWRLAAHDRGVWVLERASGRLARVTGLPVPATSPLPDDYAPGVFRPDPENCEPPELRLLDAVRWPDGERPVALANDARSGLALLSWFGDGDARLRRLDARGEQLEAATSLADARYAYALAWLDAARIAVRMPGRRDAPAFAVPPLPGGSAAPLGEVYPLGPGATDAPFAHRLDGPPRYPLGDGDAEPLYALSLPNLSRHGAAASFEQTADGLDAHLLDSGDVATVWHRLYAEASIPPGTGFVVWLAATEEAGPPPVDALDAWHPHGFGGDIAILAPHAMGAHVPCAAWERAPSELPGHPGLAPWSAEPDRRGLFTVLVQDARRRVRSVAGRYLWVRVEMFGNGRATPDVAALRAYGSRFDYAEQYLGRLYRQTLHGAAADAPGDLVEHIPPGAAAMLDAGGAPPPELVETLETAGVTASSPAILVERPGRAWLVTDDAGSGAWRLVREADGPIAIYRPRASQADFLTRFLAMFESVLTPIEARIAAAHLASDPAVAPEASLDWLGGWIGVLFDPALPASRRRDWLTAAPALARWHGTNRGLALALDRATDGGVRGGEIVLLEDFRLRRLLATLLGVDLADESDPLLPGLHRSGNSIVGDTLVLGEAQTAELLALFREEVASEDENAAVLAFLERLAHRATVLVHQSVTPQDLGLIRRVVELEAPAHVGVRVLTATWPLLVGIASLVGVDTYLGPPAPRRPARAEVSTLGAGDFVLGPDSLDPRLAGAAAPGPSLAGPVADAGPGRTVAFGRGFELDASRSRAAPGRRIDEYVWRRLPPLS
jgi:phage tail-like protein